MSHALGLWRFRVAGRLTRDRGVGLYAAGVVQALVAFLSQDSAGEVTAQSYLAVDEDFLVFRKLVDSVPKLVQRNVHRAWYGSHLDLERLPDVENDPVLPRIDHILGVAYPDVSTQHISGDETGVVHRVLG